MIYTGDKWDNEVYYRLYLSSRSNKITVVCMQNFDECDYHDSRFVKNKEGHKYYFNTEKDAVETLNMWYNSNEIDPEYLKNSDISLIK